MTLRCRKTICRRAMAVLAALLLLTASAPAALTGYIKFPDIDGESTRRGYEGWSELTALQVDVARPSDLGGRTSSIPTIAVAFSMPGDSSYPYLWLATARGVVFLEVQVDQLNDSGDVVFEHVFRDAMLSRIAITETPGGARVVGELGFVGEYESSYFQYDPTGKLTAEHNTAFDFGVAVVASTAAGLPGDYDHDGATDEADRAKWATQYGFAMTPLGGGADGNADGLVNAADYTVWRDHASLGLTPAPVPEPATAGAAVLAWAMGVAGRRAPERLSAPRSGE
ncbi:type VI secretion system tube protein Hcp [Botrimarina sp.]|uniref:type VI secretion system tube protein Hcp n=1 Tax=Botrimarina sp. TaxID=2795802 RepID=UPI0032EF5A30